MSDRSTRQAGLTLTRSTPRASGAESDLAEDLAQLRAAFPTWSIWVDEGHWYAIRRGKLHPHAPLFGVRAIVDGADHTELRTALVLQAVRTAWKNGFDEAVAAALSSAVTAPETTHPNPELLTRRELEIADLVARGLRNKDIATALVISQRTVEGHVEHILHKLDFSSRAQIAAWVSTECSKRPG
jgi:DNA-binding CsgD family transcriptional regulator